MEKLKKVLNEKNLSDRLNKIIMLLYEPAIKFWGVDKEDLILQTIKCFEIICIDDLSSEIERVYDGKIQQNGIGKNNMGLCVVTPISKNGIIIDTRKTILLNNEKSDEELSSILSHELFFHGVKSMIQPFMSQNIIMMGLDAQKYHYDDNNQVISMERTNGYGLEELSTYYGQNRIMNDAFKIDIQADKLLLDVCDSLGYILMETTLGKMILEGQITKDVGAIIDRFNSTEDNRLRLTGSNKKITWEDYNNLLDKFMTSCSSVYTMVVNDKDYNQKVDEYIAVYQQLSSLNMQILFATLLLDSSEAKKERSISNLSMSNGQLVKK